MAYPEAAEIRKFILWWMAWAIRLLFCSVPAMITIPSTQSLCSAKSISREVIFSAIKPMEQRQSETTLIHTMPPIRFHREVTLMTHGLWTGIPTRSAIWLSVSSKSSNGFAGYLLAMTSSTLRSWHLSTLLLLPFFKQGLV